MTLPRDRLDRIVSLLEAERATNWTLGDEYAQCVRDFGKGVINELATVARCSAEHIRQCIRVSLAFLPEYRPELVVLNWSDCREIYQAAKRSQGEVTPLELARKVIDKDLSMAEVKMLYKDPNSKPPVLRFAATCKCGRRTIEYAAPEDAGEVIRCRKCGEVLGKVE